MATWFGELHDLGHGLVAVDEIVGIGGDRGENGGNQFGIGRQRHIFRGAGADRFDGGAGIGLDAAGDDRHMNALCFKFRDQLRDVAGDVDHQQIGAAAGAQHLHCGDDIFSVGNGRPAIDRDFGRRHQLSVQRTNDQEPHLFYPPSTTDQRSVLIISVMVTPSFSSTRTTSPRATSRSLT